MNAPTDTSTGQPLHPHRFPRAAQYHPEWILASASGGAHPLWLAEWLAEAMHLQPGLRLLDLGCGRAASSIFLHREFGVQVWATDLWTNPSENSQRIRDAGAHHAVFPLHADARSLPFPAEFFDAIVCLDSYFYFGTDDLYLNYLAHFLKPGGQLGVAGAGLTHELPSPLPHHLRQFWTQDLWSLHSAQWLRHHWQRTHIVQVELADTLPDGFRFWLDWHHAFAPDNPAEIAAVREDAGRYLGYIRAVARRNQTLKLEEYCWPDPLRCFPANYTPKPLLKTEAP